MAVDASSPSTGRKLVAAVRSSSMVRLSGDLLLRLFFKV
jgi:hypothetical protein